MMVVKDSVGFVCGSRSSKVDYVTGKKVYFVRSCRRWSCPKCASFKRSKLMKDLNSAFDVYNFQFFLTITSKSKNVEDLFSVFSVLLDKVRKVPYLGERGLKKLKDFDFLKWREIVANYNAVIRVARRLKVNFSKLSDDEVSDFKERYSRYIEQEKSIILDSGVFDKNSFKCRSDKDFVVFVEDLFSVNESLPLHYFVVPEVNCNGDFHLHILTNKYFPHKIVSETLNSFFGYEVIYNNTLIKHSHRVRHFYDVDSGSYDYVGLSKYFTKYVIKTFEEVDYSSKKKRYRCSIGLFDHLKPETREKGKITQLDYSLNTRFFVSPDGDDVDYELSIKDCNDRFDFIESEINKYEFNDEEQKELFEILLHIKHLNENKSGSFFDVDSVERDVICDGFKLSAEQKSFIEKLNVENVVCLDSVGGSGKTFVLNYLLRYCKNKNIPFKSGAFTGKASSLIFEGVSLSRMFNSDYDEDFYVNDKNVLKVDGKYLPSLVVVDEMSFLSPSFLLKVLRGVPSGCKVVLSGDRKQIRNSSYDVFSIISERLGFVSFSENYRALEYPSLCRSVDLVRNENDFSLLDCEEFSSDDWDDKVLSLIENGFFNGDSVILSPRKSFVSKVNFFVCKSLNKGKEPLIRVGSRSFFEGERVLLNENKNVKGFFNGEMFILLGVSGRRVELQKCIDGSRVFVGLEFFECGDFSHSYALTIHKAQGSGFDDVVLFLNYQRVKKDGFELLNHNLFYTGVSRAKSSVKVFYDDERVFDLVKVPSVSLDYVEPVKKSFVFFKNPVAYSDMIKNKKLNEFFEVF